MKTMKVLRLLFIRYNEGRETNKKETRQKWSRLCGNEGVTQGPYQIF